MIREQSEIIKMLCDEDWGKMPADIFQHKMGAAITLLLTNAARTDWIQLGIVTAAGFCGGAAVWIALIIASGSFLVGK